MGKDYCSEYVTQYSCSAFNKNSKVCLIFPNVLVSHSIGSYFVTLCILVTYADALIILYIIKFYFVTKLCVVLS